MPSGPIFISYPKSGRTWIRYMMELAAIDVEFSHDRTGSHRDDLGKPFGGIHPENFRDRPTIFMHRNPIDTAVSFYFQVHRRELVPGTWKYFRRYPRYALTGRWPPRTVGDFVMHPGYGLEKVCRFNRAWLDHLNGHRDALVFTYEDVVSSGEDVVSGLLRFLGANPKDTEGLLEASKFERMRHLESKGAMGRALTPGIEGDPESLKTRRGKVRGYVDYLDHETIARCRAIAERYGFDA
jgi:hypothetical protein